MSDLFGVELSAGTAAILMLSLFVAFGFEFINGFHDTANAVATVIYTRALRPWQAVIWSGICNFAGVMLSGVAVAYAIVHLLPVEALVGMGQEGGLVMVLSILIAAVIWNFGTWYLGLPASSSHTLIGAILGVGLASSLYMGRGFVAGVNWAKAYSVVQSLLLSPMFGFCMAGALLLFTMKYIKSDVIHSAPEGNTPPPPWLRGVLIFTCTGVSFAHGSNDGQKGVGLIMLILIGILPGVYALDSSFDKVKIDDAMDSINGLEKVLRKHGGDVTGRKVVRHKTQQPARHVPGNYYRDWDHIEISYDPIPPEPDSIVEHLEKVRRRIRGHASLGDIELDQRWALRLELLQLRRALNEFEEIYAPFLTEDEHGMIKEASHDILAMTEYSPRWVLLGIALSLGFGTMIGWKRIVVTVGEKIGKTHLTYAQGGCAEMVAMSTIGAADFLGLPVSTTHVLSSGVAGTMAASKSGLQGSTVRNILLAWILTLPVSMLLSATIFFSMAAVFGVKPTIPSGSQPTITEAVNE